MKIYMKIAFSTSRFPLSWKSLAKLFLLTSCEMGRVELNMGSGSVISFAYNLNLLFRDNCFLILPGRSCLFASKRRGTPRRFSFTIICKKSYLKLFGGFRHHSFPILSLLNRIADPPDPERESLSTNNLDMNF